MIPARNHKKSHSAKKLLKHSKNQKLKKNHLGIGNALNKVGNAVGKVGQGLQKVDKSN